MRLQRLLSVCLMAAVLLTAAAGAFADLKEYVGIIRPVFNDQTNRMFKDLSDYFKKNGQDDLANYFGDIGSPGLAWHGSGWVLVDEDGTNYIITNRHVAQQAERIDFQLEQPDGSMKNYNDCPILYVDDEIDLAIAQFPDFKSVYSRSFPLNSDVQPDGQEVWSAGFPGLMGQAGWQFARGDVTNGQARVAQLIDPKTSYVIQHSASIDPGNSGGPLLLKNDKSPVGYDVIGVNTWGIRNRQNTFFAIPGKAIKLVLQKAKAARDLKDKTDQLQAKLVKDCKVLAAELGSETRDTERLLKFISYAFVGNAGFKCFVDRYNLAGSKQEKDELWNGFLGGPVETIETMRKSIYLVFLAEMRLRSKNDLSSLEFKEINASDEDKIGEGKEIRTNFTFKDANANATKVELTWIFEYGDWRISYANMKRFDELMAAAAGKAPSGGGSSGGGGGGGSGTVTKRMGLELLGAAGVESGSGAVVEASGTSNGNGFGWAAGAILDIPFSANFGISAGLTAATKGAHYTFISSGNTRDFTIVYMEIPLLLKIGLPFVLSGGNIFEIYAGGGAAFNFVLDKSGDSSGTSWTSADFTANGFKDTAFSFLVTVGIEYTLSPSMAIGGSILWDHNTASDFSSAELIFSNFTGCGYLKFLF
jgi:S1-C subfamily serine protease